MGIRVVVEGVQLSKGYEGFVHGKLITLLRRQQPVGRLLISWACFAWIKRGSLPFFTMIPKRVDILKVSSCPHLACNKRSTW